VVVEGRWEEAECVVVGCRRREEEEGRKREKKTYTSLASAELGPRTKNNNNNNNNAVTPSRTVHRTLMDFGWGRYRWDDGVVLGRGPSALEGQKRGQAVRCGRRLLLGSGRL
jgi:hypothetical protein